MTTGNSPLNQSLPETRGGLKSLVANTPLESTEAAFHHSDSEIDAHRTRRETVCIVAALILSFVLIGLVCLPGSSG